MMKTIVFLCAAAPFLFACCKDNETPQQPKKVPEVKMLTIPAGTFTMGNEFFEFHEKPTRKITLTRSFLLSKYEVTQELWKEVMGENPSFFQGDSLPVDNVTWFDALHFCNELSKKQGLLPVYTVVNDTVVEWNKKANGYRLPTEAEWEYACKAGTTTDFYTGNTSRNIIDSALDKAGWYCSNSVNKTHRVGQKVPNNYGLYDMHGNVWEWVWDWFHYWPSNDTTDWVVSDRVQRYEPVYYQRIQRGGSFHCEGPSHYGRSAHRHFFDPNNATPYFGFRIARSLQ